MPSENNGAQLMFNVNGPSLAGCQPVKGISGELRLACVDEQQRMALLESRDQEDWMHVNMPTSKPATQSQKVAQSSWRETWCPKGREDACFEAWLRPEAAAK